MTESLLFGVVGKGNGRLLSVVKLVNQVLHVLLAVDAPFTRLGHEIFNASQLQATLLGQVATINTKPDGELGANAVANECGTNDVAIQNVAAFLVVLADAILDDYQAKEKELIVNPLAHEKPWT